MVRLMREIQSDVNALAATIDAPSRLLPTYGTSEDFARPHIEARDDGLMAWVVIERGTELERKTTYSRDELLYWVFVMVTFSMAADHEVAHRVDGEDPRRLLFTRQLELLAELNPDWATRRMAELGPLLEEVGINASPHEPS